MTSDQAQLGTMLTWSDVLNPMGHQLLHTERLFCRPCLKGDEAEGRVPYQRLYWCLKPCKACVHHRLTLSSECLVCRRAQDHVPSLPFLDACQHCGASLTDGPDTSQAALPTDLWKAIEVHGLLEKSQQLRVPVPHERFLAWIRSLCDHHAEGNPHTLARLTGLDGPNVRRWVTGEAKPSLGVLLDLCYVLRCPPASIVTGQPMLTAMEVLATPPPRVPRKSPRRRSEAELTRFRTALTRIAEGDPARMPTLNEVARQLGCRRSYLTYRFAGHSRKIRTLAEQRRKGEATQRRLGRQHQATILLRRLAKKGVYPSDRHLAAAGATWHILQDPGCRRLIKAARATLRAA